MTKTTGPDTNKNEVSIRPGTAPKQPMLTSFGSGSQRINGDRPMSPYNKQKQHGFGAHGGNNGPKKRVNSNKRTYITNT